MAVLVQLFLGFPTLFFGGKFGWKLSRLSVIGARGESAGEL